MSRAMRPAALTAIAALALTACQSSTAQGEAPLAGARMGGPFTLTGENGTTVSDTDFPGQYRLMYFGYTFCPDVCPVDLARTAAALRELETSDPAKASKIQPIFVTVDPERDTPAVLKQYTDLFHPRLLGLTGSPKAIKGMEKEYAVFASREEQPGASEYLMNHTNMVVLYGPKGEPIVALPGGPEATPDQQAAVLADWVR